MLTPFNCPLRSVAVVKTAMEEKAEYDRVCVQIDSIWCLILLEYNINKNFMFLEILENLF